MAASKTAEQRRVSLEWTRHIKTKEKKEEFESLLRSSVTVLSTLKNLLEQEMQSIDSKECSIADFEDPNWSHKQAFRNGEKARLRKTLELLNFIKG